MLNKKRGIHLVSNSKAQAAVFLILSVLILLAGVLYFIYQRQSVEKKVEILNPDIAPIKSYIDNCVEKIAEDGLTQIGLSGGYINLPEKTKNDQSSYLSTFPASGFKIPYWWHDGVDAVPTEDFIRKQLATNIEVELKSCLNNFEPFANSFGINELKKALVDVKFNDNDVSVSLDYPLEIIKKSGNQKILLENFAYSIPIRFKKVYELAKSIMERENKDYFLEQRTIDLYSIDGEIPTTDVEATCKQKTWQLSNIRDTLKNLLRVNVPYIRISGTDYNPNLYVPNPSGENVYSETYFQQHYVWDVDKEADKKYSNMKVAFTYDNWPMQIYARPSDNGILKSNAQKGTDKLSFFCLHIWHFTYDINYPVLITIFDQKTNDNNAYQFNFPFKVNIDHNQPDRVSRGTTLFENIPDLSSEEFCNAVQNEITIFTVNNATGDDINDANLTFACGRYYCDMGQSNWLSFGAAAGIRKKFPYCVNGIIKGAKPGFLEEKSFIQTDVDGRSYVLALNPIKDFQNYKVVKHLLSNPSASEDLGQNEKASILIKGKNVNFESYSVYPKDAEFPLALLDNKDAVYEVTIYVANNESVLGGYIGNFSVNKNDISGANQIIFHVIEQGAASDDERVLFMSGLSSYSRNVPTPELKQ